MPARTTYELEPCPFCGGTARIRRERYYQPNVRYNVICNACYANSGWFMSPEAAAEAWNKRIKLPKEET